MTTWTGAGAGGRPRPSASPAVVRPLRLADSRGLTALGAVALALALGAVGVLIDVVTGTGLRTAFAICFVAGCAIAALKVHREDLIAVIVMPPLLFVVLALVADTFSTTGAAGGWLTRQALELATSLVLGAPVLFTATAAAFAIAVARGMLARQPGRPLRPSGE